MSVMLRDHNLDATYFFSAPSISQQARNNVSRFTSYVKTHKKFACEMIALAYNTPAHVLDNPNLRNSVHAVTDVLACEENPIAELFLDPEHEDIPEEINSIQNEAQRLFEDDDVPAEEEDQPSRPVELEKGELLTLSLSIFKEKEPNEACLGYLQKLFSYLIRTNSNTVL